MPFTAEQLAENVNAALKFYIRGPAISQSIQNKPLLKAMTAKQKTFPGGNTSISIPVKGDYDVELIGYSGTDTVGYQDENNLKRVEYDWKELHCGITLTYSQLKVDGITVVDSLSGEKTSKHSEREMTALTGILEDKLEGMSEGYARSMNEILWRDGTQDSNVFPGLTYFISTTPTTGSVGGLDRASNTWWRNRTDSFVASAANQTLTRGLRKELRQLTRYGGKPDLILCGSTFLEKLELEVQEKGVYTQEGFVKNGTLDVGLGDISMRGLGRFQYDPTLDDLGYGSRCYIIDTSAIRLRPIEGEDKKMHFPARPHDQYVLYRGMTWSGALTGDRLNSCGVYIAS